MMEIDAKTRKSAARKPDLLPLNSKPLPATIFMTSFSDVP
jgi:hypothetical protein